MKERMYMIKVTLSQRTVAGALYKIKLGALSVRLSSGRKRNDVPKIFSAVCYSAIYPYRLAKFG